MIQSWQSIALWKRVFIGLAIGALVGGLLRYAIPLPEFDDPKVEGGKVSGAQYIGQYWIYPFGQAFVRLIKMLIIPLVVTTLVSGVAALGDPKRLGSLGMRTLSLYFLTTLFAVTLGLIAGTILRPGVGVDYESATGDAAEVVEEKLVAGQSKKLVDRLLAIIPDNPLAALASGDILPTIFFAMMIGVGILLAGEAAASVKALFDSAAEVMMRLTTFIMELSPFGVAALIAWVICTKGLGVLSGLLLLTVALYGSCFLQIVLVYGLMLVRGLMKLPLRPFFSGVADAQGIAFSTASSSATLPMSISCAESKLGVEKSIAGSVLPLGATINMDGTAIYLGLVALFAAQACGLPVTLDKYVMVALLATLVSIGAAGIPSAGLLLAATVIEVVGATPEQSVMVIAFIFPFDRILDMMRTMTNVTGDLAVACTVAKWENALDETVFRAEADMGDQ
ncbi:MAG: dicarboxylate/amino acid:cation symporter [Planctomycetota bacterium]